MNKLTYPPGPWVRAVAVSVDTGLSHAAIFTRKSLNDHGAHFPLMVFDHQGTPSNGVANLVAAAPDLLAALRALLAAQEALNATGYDIAACQQNGLAEAVAVALLARLDGTSARGPESELLSGPV
jgi:hypothetical protein